MKVVLAAEQALLRGAMRWALEGQPDIDVVGEASNGIRALRECERVAPDLLILDAQIAAIDAVVTTSMVRDRIPRTRVLILSNSNDQETLLKALEAGASGYLSKDAALEELIEAARAVHHGQTRVPSDLLGGLLSTLIHSKRERDEALSRMIRLTQREREVLAILARGGDNHAIARALMISPRTAKTHVQSVLSKLELHSRLEAAAFVRRHGIPPKLMKAIS
jgi:DNA-binding NarL/FixJ family response regulator